ncbi:MAG TPA: hypothetical protein VLT91_06455 [Rhizomicrobium sp.]|nr:hypothetical protein [Rhizomicrobium sp.]
MNFIQPEHCVIDIRVFIRAAVVGTVLQVVLMVGAHFSALIERQGFLLGGMTISAVAGYLYGMDTGKGYFTSATMAAIIGGGAALIGVGVSVAMHDAPVHIVPLFTTICVVTGAVGGLFGQMSANLKKMGRR